MKIVRPVIKNIVAIFGVFATILGVFTYFYPDKAEPYYMIVNDEVAVASPTSKIKLYYDSTEIPNLKILKISLWNDGKTYIAKEKFITPYIAEISNNKSTILQVEVSDRSRDKLNISIKIMKTRDRFLIFLEGKEVLESKDFIELKIFYTSTSSSTWKVNTRIVGIPDGFKEYKFIYRANKAHYIEYKTMILAFIFILLGLVITSDTFFLYNYYGNSRLSRLIVLLIWLSAFIFIFLKIQNARIY